jgi:hypothetical protein
MASGLRDLKTEGDRHISRDWLLMRQAIPFPWNLKVNWFL